VIRVSVREMRKRAAQAALELVLDGMVLGLGSGSTAEIFTRLLADRVAEEALDIIVVPTSAGIERVALDLGLQVSSLNEYPEPDLAVDGADAVDKDLNLVKGGGACLAREKAVDYAAKRFVVIVDERKLVSRLFEVPVPVEVMPCAWRAAEQVLRRFGTPRLRLSSQGKYGPIVTDNGNFVIDLEVSADVPPTELEIELNAVPGVVENGIFSRRRPDEVIVGTPTGTKRLKPT